MMHNSKVGKYERSWGNKMGESQGGWCQGGEHALLKDNVTGMYVDILIVFKLFTE